MAQNDRSIIAQDVQEIVEELAPRLSVLRGTTLLLTGANGFLCSYLVEVVAALNATLLDPPCHVLALDNLQTGRKARLDHLAGHKGIEFVNHDAIKPFEPDRPIDWIIHGASIASPTFYRRYPLETIDVNVQGTRHMLDLARRSSTRSLLYFSTSEIYGDPPADRIPTAEDYRGNVSCTGPRACYDESKRLAETLCFVYHQRHGVPVKTIRPFNVYGPGQRLDDRRIIPDVMSAALHRKPLVLYSDGRATRAFCYISDAIRAIWYVLLSDANGEAFNVGSDQEEITIRGLAERVQKVAGPPELVVDFRRSEESDYLTDNPQRRCPDLTKLRTRFPWTPRVSLEEGLRRTLRSYQESQEG